MLYYINYNSGCIVAIEPDEEDLATLSTERDMEHFAWTVRDKYEIDSYNCQYLGEDLDIITYKNGRIA